MKRMMFALLMGTMIFGCNAQDKGNSDQTIHVKDSLATSGPHATWKVDREVDENGNVVRYDSIYSYSYGNMDSIPLGIDLDGIMKKMPFFSQGNFSDFMADGNLKSFFGPDSLMQGRRFFEEFFEGQRGHDFSDIKQLMQQMDSLQRTIMGRNDSLFLDPFPKM